MGQDLPEKPRLRPVEAFPLADGQEGRYAIRDPSGIAETVLTVSGPAMFLLALFDGRHSLARMRERFVERFGQPVAEQTLLDLTHRLQAEHFLDGRAFEEHLDRLTADYASAPVRRSLYGRELGSRRQVSDQLRRLFNGAQASPPVQGRVAGVIAPHLDYPRGGPCYADAYGALAGRPTPQRCVILGTNHFGRSTSVVATTKPFETPLGVTEVDTAFVEALEQRCGRGLRHGELDHQREHSVELQVLCLQHRFGPEAFRIVPLLCPDPCGPTGTEPCDGQGVDLRSFAQALAALIADSGDDTLLIAGADLSHVGRQFGDTFALEPTFLSSIETRDRTALARLESARPEAFIRLVGHQGNPTRVCSAGCMFVLATVLYAARPRLLRYHQAFNETEQVCVSCAAMIYTQG